MDAHTPAEALNWLTGLAGAGGLGTFIYLVRLFLDRQKQSDDAQTAQREQHSHDQKDMRDSFTTIVGSLGDRFSGELKETRGMIENITDKFAAQHEAQMKINTETVVALNGLRADVHELKGKVD